MRFFFRSRQFKIIILILCALIAVSATFGVVGGRLAPQADVFGTIAAPFRSFGSKISDIASDFFQVYEDSNKLVLKNTELQQEIDELRKKLAEYDNAVAQNELYKNYLEIKTNNSDFKFCDATLIARDTDDPYGGFVINRGSLSGISKHDPVITEAGVVGYITDVGLTTSKVTTILSSDITMGALDNRTNDSGIISGALEFVKEGYCKFYNLARSCNVAVGDYVVTSGEGIFPDGLLVGTIESVGTDKYSPSIFAKVKPFVDFSVIRSVMVITEFEGQGGIVVGDSQ